MKKDDMGIEIEAVKRVGVPSLDGELEKPKKGIARFMVSLNPYRVISRKVLIYSDGRVYLDD